MPLDGSDIASKPAGTTAAANETIESADYNATIDDIYSIFNSTRTIAKGYTGATTAAGARTNFSIASVVVDKSANYTALLADRNKTFNFTAAATLSLTAAATLTSDWVCEVKANGGAITIDPDGSETIDGSSTLVLADGASAVIRCDGTNFHSLVSASQSYVDTRSKWIHLSTQTPSAAASVVLTGLSAYRMIRATGYLVPATDNQILGLQTSTDNGSSYDAGTGYSYMKNRANNTTTAPAVSNASDSIHISPTEVGSDTTEAVNFEINITEFNQASQCWLIGNSNCLDLAGSNWVSTISGRRLDTTARDALQLKFASGSIESGVVVFEGLVV